MGDLVAVETHSGAPIEWRGLRLTPYNRVVHLRLPGLRGGLIWNRPAYVKISAADGVETTIAVADPTRQVLLALAGASAVCALVWWATRGFASSKD